MDVYAAAAADLCETVEAVAPERFAREVESDDPDGASIRAVCRHVVRSGWGHMNYIRRVRALPVEPAPEASMASPADLRPLLVAVLRYADATVEGLTDTDEVLAPLRFQVGWGPTYDPEMMLEHTIVHLQRHRRQIIRWPG